MKSKLKLIMAAAAGASMICAGIARAAPITLLQENFNAVDLSGSPVRSVDEILFNSPGELTPGMLSLGFGANVRRANNEINTNAAPDGFGGFFNSKFLVLGDDAGGIGGNPSGAGEDSLVFLPFSIPGNAHRIRVSFDWAFNGIDTSDNNDRLRVGIVGAGGITNVLRLRSDRDFGADSSFSRNFDVPVDLGPGDYLLGFLLNETGNGNGRTNTAAGIDNIRIRAQVPAPATLLLLGAGFAGIAATARRSGRLAFRSHRMLAAGRATSGRGD